MNSPIFVSLLEDRLQSSLSSSVRCFALMNNASFFGIETGLIKKRLVFLVGIPLMSLL